MKCPSIILLIILLPVFSLSRLLSVAQSVPISKAIFIGDSVPETPPISIINYSDSTATLNDFSNELIIIDFWATWCAPCIKVLPELQKLQKKFGTKLQFLLATRENKNTVTDFLQKKKITLPSFVDDKILAAYFPHNTVPHEVWIHNRKVIAITYAEEVTEENIQRVLNGKSVNFTLKKENFGYNLFAPLLVDGNGGGANDLKYHSIFTGYLDGLGGGGILTDSQNRFKIRALNHSVVDLFRFAAERIDEVFSIRNRILIEADKKKIDPEEEPQYTPSVREFFYCYELIIPAASNEDAVDFMMQDLNRYFGMAYQIKGEIKNRKMLCWILRKNNKSVATYTKNEEPVKQYKDGYAIWRNQPFSKFFYTLANKNQSQPYPFIDETGIEGNIDVKFPMEPKDVPSLQSYLETLDLKLSLEEREIPMLVIRDIKN